MLFLHGSESKQSALAKLYIAVFRYARTAAYAERSGFVQCTEFTDRDVPIIHMIFKGYFQICHGNFILYIGVFWYGLMQSMGLPYVMQHRNGADYEKSTEAAGGRAGQADGRSK